MPDAYLDHAASTPMRPEAVAAMQPLLGEVFANPSGSHRWARDARRRLDDARDQVAELVGARPGEVVFTSGGTEADNLAIAGVVGAMGGRAVCSAVEHHAVLEPVLATGGSAVAVDRLGCVDHEALAAVLAGPAGSNSASGPASRSASPDGLAPVSIVSVMLANNETGAVNDLASVAEIVHRSSPGTVLHTDAVAAGSWLDLVEVASPADLVSISGHKLGGPKGIGALVVRGGLPLEALLRGGGQERERRGGTPNVAGAVGLAAALAASVAARDATNVRVEALRARLVAGLRRAVPDLVETSPGDPAHRTPGTLLVCIPGVEREALLFLLDEAGLGASWGSSCSSGATEPSHVLMAMGLPADLARGALRLSLGWCSTDADIDHALTVIPASIGRLRRSPRRSPSPPRAAGPADPAGVGPSAAAARGGRP